MTGYFTEQVVEIEQTAARQLRRRRPANKSERLETAAHGLRGPACAIAFFAELLEEELSGRLSKEQQELLVNIRLASEAMLARIDEFTAASL